MNKANNRRQERKATCKNGLNTVYTYSISCVKRFPDGSARIQPQTRLADGEARAT